MTTSTGGLPRVQQRICALFRQGRIPQSLKAI
jgi:hypothetical protein